MIIFVSALTVALLIQFFYTRIGFSHFENELSWSNRNRESNSSLLQIQIEKIKVLEKKVDSYSYRLSKLAEANRNLRKRVQQLETLAVKKEFTGYTSPLATNVTNSTEKE